MRKATRSDKGGSHKRLRPFAISTGSVKKAQQKCMKAIADGPVESGRDSVFGAPLNVFRQRHSKAQEMHSEKAKQLLSRYKVWTSTKVAHAAKPQAKRFAKSATEVKTEHTKQSAKAQFEKQMRADLRRGVMTDVTVKIDSACKLDADDLPHPFRRVGMGQNASLFIVPDLAVASHVRHTSDDPEVQKSFKVGGKLNLSVSS